MKFDVFCVDFSEVEKCGSRCDSATTKKGWNGHQWEWQNGQLQLKQVGDEMNTSGWIWSSKYIKKYVPNKAM